MSLLSVYNAGTVSVVAGSTQVTGFSTGWIGAGVREGDYLWIAGFVVRIASCEGGQALTLAYPWPSTTMNKVAYEIQYTSDVERTLGSAQNVLASLRSGSFGALSALNPATDKVPYFTGHNTADITALTSYGRQVIGAADKNALQTILDLVAQSGDLDKTLNRVMKVGAFGLGTTAAPLIDNIDSFEAAAGFYKVDARSTKGVLPPSSNVADGLIILHPTASQTMQVYLGMTELGRNFIRKSNSDGTWAPWRSIMLDFEFGAGPGSGLDADTVDGYEADDFVKASDFTSNGMLAYIKNVDGSGSGLDADLLDGQHGSYYMTASTPQTITGEKTFNTSPVFNGGGILFENGESRITYNDGGGNFTHRWGHEYVSGTGDVSTRANMGAVLMKVNYEFGTTEWVVELAPDSTVNAGDSVSFTDVLRLRQGTFTWNNRQVATEHFVNTRINEIVGAAPGALDTLNELAEALGDDPNFATTVNNNIGKKLDTTAFTGSAILSRLVTVDGSGSGLDADLLDGKHASAFLNLDVDQTTDGRITFNGTGGEKIRLGLSGSSAPYIGLYAGSSTRIGYLQSTSNRIRLAVDGGANLDLSSTSGDALINGNTIMHTGNDGANSGFDADLLDGQHGSFYRDASNLNTGTVPAARLGNALLSTGGKITGDLQIENYQPGINFFEDDRPVGSKGWRLDAASGTMRLMSTNDSGGDHNVLYSFARDGELNVNASVVTRSNGDARYARTNSYGYFSNLRTGAQNAANKDKPNIIFGVDSAGTQDGISWVTTSGAYFIENNSIIGEVSTNDGLSNSYTIVTRASGDGRYTRKSGDVIEGILTVRTTNTKDSLRISNGDSFVRMGMDGAGANKDFVINYNMTGGDDFVIDSSGNLYLSKRSLKLTTSSYSFVAGGGVTLASGGNLALSGSNSASNFLYYAGSGGPDTAVTSSVILSRKMGDARYVQQDASYHYVQLLNKEIDAYNVEGRLFYDASAGVYCRTTNALWNGTAPFWSRNNMTATNPVQVSYDSENRPTIYLGTGAVASDWVGSQYAGVGFNAQGSIVFGTNYSGSSKTRGDTINGSDLHAAGESDGERKANGTMTGTWRCMGHAPGNEWNTCWVRIS